MPSQREVAVRIHHRLVSIHPFPNGNGRCTRMVADLYLRSVGSEPLTWGGADLGGEGDLRAAYLAALRKADEGDLGPLVAFADAS